MTMQGSDRTLDHALVSDWERRAAELARCFGLEEIRIRWSVEASGDERAPEDRAMIDLPLWLDGRQIGALVIVSADGRDFTGGDPAAMRRLLLLREALERDLAERT